MNIGSVEAQLILDDMFTSVLKNAEAQLTLFENRLRQLQTQQQNLTNSTKKNTSAIDSFTKSVMGTITHVAAAAATYKLFATAIDSVSKAVEFERTMVKIENVTTTTNDEISKFRANLSAMVRETGRGPQELAEGFYAVSSVIDDVNVSTQVLGQSAKLAAIGLGETNDISRALAASINAYGVANLDAATASNQLLTAVKLGGAEASEYSGSLGRVVGIAAQMGISFAEVNASIATFTRLGVGADEAVTALRGTISALLNPTKEGERALASIGMTMDDLRASVKDRGLAVTMIELVQAFKGNEQALEPVIHNVRALAGLLANAGSQSKAYLEILRQIEGNTTAVGDAMTRLRESPAFNKWDRVKAQFEELMITLGSALLPGVEALRDAVVGIDPNHLARFGKASAEVLTSLASVVELVVTNFDRLRTIMGFLPSNLVGKALMFLIEKFNELSGAVRRMQGDIDKMVGSFSRISAGLAGAQRAIATGNVDTMGAELAKLRNEEEKLLETHSRHAAEVKRLSKAVAEGTGDVQANRAALDAAQLRYNQANATLGKHRQGIDEIIAAMRGWRGEAEKPLPPVAPPIDPAFANRFEEVLERLRSQIDAVKEQTAANSAMHRDRMAQITGEQQAEEEITLEKRQQLAFDRLAHALQTDKLRLSGPQLAALRAQSDELVRQQDAQKAIAIEEREQEKRAKLIAAAKVQMLVLDEKRAERERAVAAAMRQQVEIVQDRLGQMAVDLQTQERYFSALVEGGREAARFAELESQYRQEHVENAAEVAAWQVEIETRAEKIAFWTQQVGALAKPAWQRYAEIALGAIDAVTNALGTAISQAFKEGEVDWKGIWQNLMDSLLDMFVQMLMDMLKQWLVTQAAMAATDYASGGGNFKTGGKGGAGDYVKMAQQGYGAYQTATGAGAAGGAGGFSSLGITANMAAGVAGAALFAYIIYKGFFEDFQNKFAKAVIGGNGLVIQATNTAQHGQKHVKGLNDAIDGVSKFIFSFLDTIDVKMTQFGKVTISKIGAGWIVGNQLHKTLDEAIKAATAHMIKYGEFSDSVSLLVREAIKNTKEITLEAIQANTEFARMIENIGKSQTELDIGASWDQFLADLERAVDLFGKNGEALSFAITQLGVRLVDSMMSAYYAITGAQPSPAEQLRMRQQAAVLYNAQKKMMIAELQLRQLEIKGRLDALNANAQLLQAENAMRQAQLEALQAYLAALGVVIEQLTTLPDIDPASLVPNIGGGGGGGGGKGDVRDWLRDRQRAFDDSLMADWARQQAEIMRLYEEQLRLAGDDIVLRQQLIELRDREIQQLRQQAILSAVNRFQAFMSHDNPFAQLEEDAQAAVDAIVDSPMGDERKARMIARVWERLGEKMLDVANEMTRDMFSSLAADLEAIGADELKIAEARRLAAILEHQMKMQNYRVELAMLRASGLVAEDTLATLEGMIDILAGYDVASGGVTPPPIPRNPNDPYGMDVMPAGYMTEFGGFRWKWDGHRWLNLGPISGTGPGGTTQGGKGGTTPYDPTAGPGGKPADDFADALKRARAMLEDWMKLGVHPLVAELNEFHLNVKFLKDTLGDTAEVAEAAARKYKDILSKYLDPIAEWLQAQPLSPTSSLSGADQFFYAQQQFRNMMAALEAGDLTQLDNVTAFADQYLELARSFTGGEGFTFIEKEIRDAVAKVLTIAPNIAQGLPPLGSINNPSTTVSPQLQQTIEHTSQLTLTELRIHTGELKSANAKLSQMATALDNPLNVRNIA